MNKRVYGVIGISSIMANWNADFSGYPKSISDGTVFGSDKALKYPMKKMWENEGRKVLFIRSMHLDKGKINLIPRTLKERYEHIFNVGDLKTNKDAKVVLSNLFKAVDVKNFGATFPEDEIKLSITGAVQIGQGFNKYKDSETHVQSILSPFGIPKIDKNNNEKKKRDAKSTSLGTKIVSDEAHYFYPFAINPMAYKEFIELGVTDGYTEEDYQLFKDAALSSATSFATNAKLGCENEFALFIETESDLYLPNLSEYIEFTKAEDNDDNGKNKIHIDCGEVLNSLKDRILTIEIYYNTITTEIDTHETIEGAKYFNILNRKEA